MTRRHTNTVIGATHAVLSKDGTTISYLSIGGGPSVIVIAGILSMELRDGPHVLREVYQ